MTKWSKKLIQETKTLFRDEYGTELSTEDAIECLENMTRLAEILVESYREQKARGIDILADSD